MSVAAATDAFVLVETTVVVVALLDAIASFGEMSQPTLTFTSHSIFPRAEQQQQQKKL